jgi:hypothetical protein
MRHADVHASEERTRRLLRSRCLSGLLGYLVTPQAGLLGIRCVSGRHRGVAADPVAVEAAFEGAFERVGDGGYRASQIAGVTRVATGALLVDGVAHRAALFLEVQVVPRHAEVLGGVAVAQHTALVAHLDGVRDEP